jgi:type VI secretion system secreted protein VgrG
MSIADFGLELESHTLDASGFRVFALEGREAISELYRFDVDAVWLGDGPVPELVPGDSLALSFRLGGRVVRRVDGMIDRVLQRIDSQRGDLSWRIRIVPRAARLSLVATQSIYLGQSAPDIIRSKIELVELGSELAMNLTGRYPALDFVAQYNESDLAFVSRRSEHIGISFFFRNDDDVERIVFTDHLSAFPSLPEFPTLEITSSENALVRVVSFEREDTMVTGLYAVQDYNYRRPDHAVSGSAALEGGAGGLVEYGAHVKSAEEAQTLARIRSEEIGCRRRVYRGATTVPGLIAGHRTVIEEHGVHPETELLLTAVEHRASLPLSGDSQSAAGYSNRFEAVDTGVAFRPRRVTPKPVVPGIVTGMVQPLAGTEPGGTVVLDDVGRYVIQLHLETVFGTKIRASHAMRMSQPYGGTGHGMHFPLRPGTEVILAFTNGDPDRPIVLGAVPNAHTRSPVTSADPRLNRLVTKAGAVFEIGERE